MKFYKCNICGNLVELVNVGGGELVCCNEPMEELVPKIIEEGKEKHIPKVIIEGTKITVKVGKVEHPMTQEHFIQWIVINYNNKFQRMKLNPNFKPEAKFIVEEDFEVMEVYEYCNIHGLWKNEIKRRNK